MFFPESLKAAQSREDRRQHNKSLTQLLVKFFGYRYTLKKENAGQGKG